MLEASANSERDMLTTVSVLLSTARSSSKPAKVKLDALDDLSKILLSGRSDSELSVAAITAAWSEPAEDVAHKFVTENLAKLLLPALGQVMMDRDVTVSKRAALVLARIGASLGSNAGPFFTWVLKGVETQATQDPIRLSIHLSVLSQALQLGQRDCLQPFLQDIVQRLTNLLERIQHHQLVQPVVVVLQEIASDHPQALSAHFPDVVDLLVGWSLDANVPPPARDRITRTFAHFNRSLWQEHAGFAGSMVHKFMADIEALHRTLPHSSAQALPEMIRLAHCCVGVVEGLGDARPAAPDPDPAIASDPALCPRLLRCFEAAGPAASHLRQHRPAIMPFVLRLQAMLLKTESPHTSLATEFVLGALAESASKEPVAAAQTLEVMGSTMVTEHGGGLDMAAAADALLSGSSCVPALRLSAHRGICLATRTLYLRLLELSESSVVAEMLVSELSELCAGLSREQQQVWERDSGASSWHHALLERSRAIREKQTLAVFVLSVLQEWVEGKSTAWTPRTVHHMLTCVADALSCEHQSVHVNVLKTAALSAAASYAVNAQEQDRQVAQLVVDVAGRCLRAGASQVVSKCAVDALAAVSGNSFCEMSPRTTMQLAHLVVAAARDCDADVRAHAADCAVLATRRGIGQAGCALMLTRECIARLSDVDKRVASDYLWAVGQVAHAALLHPPRLYSKHYSPLLGVREWQRELAAEAGVAAMRAADLPRFISFISQRGNAELRALLPRMMLASEAATLQTAHGRDAQDEASTASASASASAFGSVGGSHSGELPWGWDAERSELWAQVEAARFCVRSRLRTSFGGPMQTFEALETMLLEACARGELEVRRGESVAGQQGNKQDALRMLLHFLGHLERQVFNAFEGSVKLPPCGVNSSKFFRGNRKVCEDWFSRLRKSLTRASAVAAAPYNVLEHGLKRLPELCKQASKASPASGKDEIKKLQRELDLLVISICTALRDVRDADGIEGFAAWAKTNAKQLGGVRDCGGWIQALSLQCRGHLQEAEEMYREVFASVSNPDVQAFIVKNAVWCCSRLVDWDSWRHWRDRVGSLPSDPSTSASLAEARREIESDVIRALASFDTGDRAGAEAHLGKGGGVGVASGMGLEESVAGSRALMLKGMLLLERGENKAANAELSHAQRLLVEPLAMSRMDMGAQLPAATQPLVLLSCIARLQDRADEGERAVPLPGEDEVVTATLPKCEAAMHDLGLWQELLRVVQTCWGSSSAGSEEERRSALTQLRLKIAGIARKQRNFKYVEGLLSKEGASLKCQYEMAMLRLSRHEHAEGLAGLWSVWRSVEAFMAEADDFVLVGAEADAVREIGVKTLRKVADCIQDGGSAGVAEVLARMTQDTATGWGGWAGTLSMPLDRSEAPEGIGGYLLHKCTVIHSEQAKAWAEYASWCYRQGRNQTDSMTRMSASASGSGRRAKEEAMHARVAAALAIGDAGVASGTNELVLRVAEAMNFSGEEVSLDPDSGSQEATLRAQLEQICPWAGQQQLDALVGVWRSGRLHALHLYQSAVHAYFEYLRISQGSAESAQSAWTDAYDVTATLRLLRLLVKYGRDMQDMFAAHLPLTPTRPWRSIVPQLFARLGHAEPRVRELVRALITRIGAETPHAIIYPTVVGHMEVEGGGGGQSKELGGILQTLRETRPELVTDVQRVISELARCTILKEDELASVLQEISQSISGGLRMMREEVMRVRDNATLPEHDRLRILKEKYDAITKPANMALEPVKKLFLSCADCDHDRSFVAIFRQPFLDALQTFREPDVYHPDQAWEPMKALIRSLNRQLRRNTLSLRSVSPFLAGLRSTDIPMPGVAMDEESDAKRVTVQAFQGHMELLLTKTKPKKITVVGSDGQEYSFLLKGREDLHLDERMMQLLDIVNTLMRQDRASHSRDLSARHYAVIPVGPRSGLIQWCQGTIPLFGVYKAWQARQQGATEGKEVQPMRPSDMFYEKIMPALKDYGITRVTSRKEWPHEVLKRVYTQLLQETPRDLLARELWCSCVSPAELWAKTNVHARSVAVMSMVGYVTGLGDRHLDNILMDFGSGEVVHIDWNVCFEKGLKLKVPELVPYRMTHTLQASIGFSGVEGPFRIACEKALRVLRRNKEALLTLLEAFVYDPLVDWTADKVNDQASKTVELHVSLSLFASRVDEMKVVLSENLQRGQQSIGTLQQALANWLHAQTAESACKQEAEEMGGMLRVVQDKLKHIDWEHKEKSERLKKMNAMQPHVESQWTFAKGKLQEAIRSCAQSFAQQDSALTFVRGTQMLARKEQLAVVQMQPVPTSPLSSWAAAMGLFGARAPAGLSDQGCLALEEQYGSGFQRALSATVDLVAAVTEYREQAKNFPPEYAKLGRAFEWLDSLQRVLDDASPQVLSMVRSHFSAEQVAVKCQESATRWGQLEEQDKTLRASLDDMRAWLASTSVEEMEQKLAETRRAAMQQEGFQELGRVAGCVELCVCLKMLLEMKVEGSRDVEPAFAVALQEGAQDTEYMEWMWLNDGVWEAPETLSRIASTCLLVAKDVVHRGIDMLQGFCLALERVASFSNDLSRVILPEAIRALHSDAEVVLHVRAFLDLAGRVRQAGKELTAAVAVEGGVEWKQDTVDGELFGQSGGALTALKREYERVVSLEGQEASGGRVLLAAFDRVFTSLDKDSGSSTQQASVSWLLNMFVGKVMTMEVLLVGILRCGSVPHAQSKLPAMRARVQRFANDQLRRLILPRLSDSLTDLVLPLMPPDAVPPLHARPLDRSAVHASVVFFLQRSAADQRVSAVHGALRRYCDGAAKLRATRQRYTEVCTSVQRTEQQLQAVLLQQAQLAWVQGDLLAVTPSLDAAAAPSHGEKVRAERLEVLQRLSAAAMHAHASVAAFTELDGRFGHAEQELTRIGQAMPSSSGFSVEAINRRVQQRRAGVVQPLEWMKEVVGVGQSLRMLELCRANGELGQQMDSVHLELLGRVEEGRRGMLAHHHESSTLDGRLKEIAQERAALRGRAGQLQMGGGEKRRGVVEGQEGCRRELTVMCGCVGPVRELLQAEEQLISETSGLLDSVAKVTENAEAVHDIHHVATELKKEQQALKQAAADLAQRITALPLLSQPSQPPQAHSKRQNSGAVADGKEGLDPAGARRMERLASEVLATMGLCHSHLGTLAQLASSHAQASQHGPAELVEAPVFHVGSVNGGGEQGGGEGGGQGAEGRREQRNAYAVSVLKKVQQKMDGREREGGKMGVAEQVGQTIKDATSAEKLCEMYEGWTPWT